MLVEWAGCAGIRTGPICELGRDRSVTIWVAGAADAGWSITTGHDPAPVKARQQIDDGTRLTVEVPTGAKTIAVVDAAGGVRWSLAVDEARPREEIEKLVARGRAGHYEEALAGLDALRARATAADRGPADAAIGRMALALGKVDRAEPAFRASIAAAQAEGRIGDVVRDGSALTWALVMLEQRFADARTVLDTMKASADQYPEGRVWIDYHAGLLAAHTGDVRTALEHYRAAEHSGRRLDRATLVENASMEVALQLTRVGRADEAIASLKALAAPVDPCARASWALNLAWTLMERARDRPTRQRDPEAWNALISAERATQACPDPHRQLLAIINSAEYALEIEDDTEVARLVAAMRALPVERDVLLGSWSSDVLGRWSLRQRQARPALAAFEDETRAARGAGLMEEELRGEVGAGRALLALGRRDAAIARLETAQKVLDEMMRDIPLGEGRASFLGGHDDGVRTLVGALVDGGSAREALRVAREARAAELAHAARIDRLSRLAPEARRRWDEELGRYQRIRNEVEHQAENDWTVPRESLAQLRANRQARTEQARAALDEAYQLLVDDHRDRRRLELSHPAAHEVYLAFFPGQRGWFALAATPARTIAHLIDDNALASPADAAKVLAGFRSELTAARRVRLFPYGASDRIAWHALPWNGRPLAASLEVEYGLDVPTRAEPRPTRDGPSAALIVANPTGDLPAATSEADMVARALGTWRVKRLDGASATRGALLDELTRARLFHYAGHAEVAGAQGLSSALLLGGNARIELGDLLAAAAVPELVVLSACEAAGTSGAHPSLMGLAQAFIAAGSRAVVAPDRPVGDTAARAFVGAFYPAFVAAMATPNGSVSSAFHEAVTTMTASGITGDGDWQSFRLLVP